jgi:O-antigen ligase
MDRVESWAFGLLAASIALVQFNLLTAQVLFGLSALLWLRVAIADGQAPQVPSFFWPLLIYAALTLASACVSVHPELSLIDCKQLILLLFVPMTMRLMRGDRAVRTINLIVALGAAGALVGIVEYALLGFDTENHRPMGLLSHYMTYSGVVMLVLCAAVARLIFHRAPRVWPGIAIPALIVALAVTLARNAWIGAVLAVSVLLALRNWRLVIVVPAVLIVGLAIAPSGIRARAFSIVDPHNPTNRDRVAMLYMGREIVRDHPFFGVGPDMIKVVYPQYRPSWAVNPTNPHLHDVPMQIAAERGLPALAVWLWFIVVALRDLTRRLRRGEVPAVSAAGLAAIVAMLGAGLFEYNFGDSEFLILFLGLITLPYAAALPAMAPAASVAARLRVRPSGAVK